MVFYMQHIMLYSKALGYFVKQFKPIIMDIG